MRPAEIFKLIEPRSKEAKGSSDSDMGNVEVRGVAGACATVSEVGFGLVTRITGGEAAVPYGDERACEETVICKIPHSCVTGLTGVPMRGLR